MDRLEQFLNFVEQAPTAFHAAAGFRDSVPAACMYAALRNTTAVCAAQWSMAHRFSFSFAHWRIFALMSMPFSSSICFIRPNRRQPSPLA